MNWFAQLPLEQRIFTVALIATLFCGPPVNWAIASLSYFGQRVSPWSRTTREPQTSRQLIHFVPIIGWLFRKDHQEGWSKHYWVRPLLLELLVPIAITFVYYWEVTGSLLPNPTLAVAPMPLTSVDLHWQAVGHLALMLLLVAATFIDFDEMLIPDAITIPGTLFALVGSVLIPQWHLWIDLVGPNGRWPHQLQLTSPGQMPTWVGSWIGLCVAIGIFLGWCFALADRRIILRRGFKKSIQYFFAGLVRRPTWLFLLAMAVVGSLLILIVYSAASATAWNSLFCSLGGIAIGGSIVWAVRIVAGLALGMEALGFGDVILMAMVGAFLGWQPVAISFFYAPFFALGIVLVKAIITGNTATPFGPYLCAATIYCLLRWDAIWNQTLQERFAMGYQLIIIFVALFLLMGAMLAVWRLIKRAVFQH